MTIITISISSSVVIIASSSSSSDIITRIIIFSPCIIIDDIIISIVSSASSSSSSWSPSSLASSDHHQHLQRRHYLWHPFALDYYIIIINKWTYLGFGTCFGRCHLCGCNRYSPKQPNTWQNVIQRTNCDLNWNASYQISKVWLGWECDSVELHGKVIQHAGRWGSTLACTSATMCPNYYISWLELSSHFKTVSSVPTPFPVLGSRISWWNILAAALILFIWLP